MTQEISVVNGWRAGLKDAEVAKVVAATQKQIDRDFMPKWIGHSTAVKLVQRAANAIPKDAWPIYLNRHSSDVGVLGWHTDEGNLIFGRVFVGDCIRYGLHWSTDFGHEVLETMADPLTNKTWAMPDRRVAAYEVADAVESDDFAYQIDGVWVTDFVLPSYFSTGAGPWDFGGHLHGPCPALTPGGYMSIRDRSGHWGQVEADRIDGMRGRRVLMPKRWRLIRRQVQG